MLSHLESNYYMAILKTNDYIWFSALQADRYIQVYARFMQVVRQETAGIFSSCDLQVFGFFGFLVVWLT